MKTPELLCEKNTWNYKSESISRLYNMFVSTPPKLSVVKSMGYLKGRIHWWFFIDTQKCKYRNGQFSVRILCRYNRNEHKDNKRVYKNKI
jgi:hypothetical protein